MEGDGREWKMVHSLSQLKKDMEAHRTLGYTALVRHGIIRNGNLFSLYTLFLFFRLHNHKATTLMSWETDHFFHTHWPTSLADIGGCPNPTN